MDILTLRGTTFKREIEKIPMQSDLTLHPTKSYCSCNTASNLAFTEWKYIVKRKITAEILQKYTLQSTGFLTFSNSLSI